MRFKEQKLWDDFRKEKPPFFWLQRIENMVGAGLPDVYLINRKNAAWVELKSVIRPVKMSTRYLGDEGLRTSQKGWHTKAGIYPSIRSYVLIRDDKNEINFLAPGEYAYDINDWDLKEIRKHSLADSFQSVYDYTLRKNIQ